MGGQDDVSGGDISVFHFTYLQCSDFVPGMDGLEKSYGDNFLGHFPVTLFRSQARDGDLPDANKDNLSKSVF